MYNAFLMSLNIWMTLDLISIKVLCWNKYYIFLNDFFLSSPIKNSGHLLAEEGRIG